MKKYKHPGTCDQCFFGLDAYYKKENAVCSWHEGKPIKFKQEKCGQFMRADHARRK